MARHLTLRIHNAHGVVTMSGCPHLSAVRENPSRGDGHAWCRVVMTDLEVGDRVWFPGYENGVVEIADALVVWIRWERGGLLRHYVADIAEHLEPAR